MRGLAGLFNAHGAEGRVVFHKLDPGLQGDCGLVQRLCAGYSVMDKLAGKLLAAKGLTDRQLAEVKVVVAR